MVTTTNPPKQGRRVTDQFKKALETLTGNVTDAAERGHGALEARRLSTGAIKFYFRYSGPAIVEGGPRERVRIELGTLATEKSPAGITLEKAREEAAILSKRYRNGDTDLRGALAADEAAKAAAKAAEAAAKAEAAARDKATLGALLDAYVAWLHHNKKASAHQVELAIDLHVKKASLGDFYEATVDGKKKKLPNELRGMWDKPLHTVTLEDLIAIVSRVDHAGHTRAAEKLRSYIRAAYSAAVAAHQRPSGLTALKILNVRHDLARDMKTVQRPPNYTGTRGRALSLEELRAYWRRISSMEDADGALLRFHLLTGGQRVEQLSRVTVRQCAPDNRTIDLFDGKGRRNTPRKHVVPLIPDALKAMDAMRGKGVGPYLFTVSQGKTPATYAMMQVRLAAVVASMIESGELAGEWREVETTNRKGERVTARKHTAEFTVGDLRRTVETVLGKAKVSKQDRAQLQSHGIGGVQDRHYDLNDYEEAKREALETLHRLITGKGATVTPIARARKKAAKTA